MMSDESGAIKVFRVNPKDDAVTETDKEGFEWAAFFTVTFDLLAATVLFLVIFACAILTDGALEWLQTAMGVHADPLLVTVRKTFKYVLIGVDCLVVLAFVLRGLAKTWSFLRRG